MYCSVFFLSIFGYKNSFSFKLSNRLVNSHRVNEIKKRLGKQNAALFWCFVALLFSAFIMSDIEFTDFSLWSSNRWKLLQLLMLLLFNMFWIEQKRQTNDTRNSFKSISNSIQFNWIWRNGVVGACIHTLRFSSHFGIQLLGFYHSFGQKQSKHEIKGIYLYAYWNAHTLFNLTIMINGKFRFSVLNPKHTHTQIKEKTTKFCAKRTVLSLHELIQTNETAKGINRAQKTSQYLRETATWTVHF